MVIVSYKVFPAHLGGQKGIVLFYQYLKAHHQLYLAVSDDNEPAGAPYVVKKLLHPHRRTAFNLLKLSALQQMVRQHNIQCIVAEHSYTGWLGLLLRWMTGVPFVIHSHNNEASRFRQMGKKGWKLYKQYERWIHRKANFNFFKTEEEKQEAVRSYRLKEELCHVVPYGIETKVATVGARELVESQYSINSRHLFYFNGTLDYAPNQQAVVNLINNINPRLLTAGIDFTILISGKFLSTELQEKISQTPTIRYLHFVEDAGSIYESADLFLNPVINDSGVKTKVVEALSRHCTVVSTRSGASGIPGGLCQQKLLMADDGDWQAFTDKIIAALQQPRRPTPDAFFSYFAWEKIAEKAAICLDDTIHNAGK